MSKKKRIKIKLVSSSGSKHFYTSVKNKKNSNKRIILKKYDPIIRKRVIYKENKIK